MPSENRPPPIRVSVRARWASCIGCCTWIGMTADPDLDAVDLTKGDAERDRQVGVVGQLGHPDPAEALVAQLGEVVHQGVDR